MLFKNRKCSYQNFLGPLISKEIPKTMISCIEVSVKVKICIRMHKDKIRISTNVRNTDEKMGGGQKTNETQTFERTKKGKDNVILKIILFSVIFIIREEGRYRKFSKLVKYSIS